MLIARGLGRALAATAILLAAYYLAPLDRAKNVPVAVSLTIAMVALGVVVAYQVRAIIRSPYPAVRGVQALATSTSLFLLLFAANYFLMAQSDPRSFNVHALTRNDALYFTVTVFSTVGFGDITATSQAARLIVVAQMLLDLLILGLGVKAFVGAVQRGRERRPTRDAIRTDEP
jgi:voltage-gated potassium channel